MSDCWAKYRGGSGRLPEPEPQVDFFGWLAQQPDLDEPFPEIDDPPPEPVEF